MIYLAIQTVASLKDESFIVIQYPAALLAGCQYRSDFFTLEVVLPSSLSDYQ